MTTTTATAAPEGLEALPPHDALPETEESLRARYADLVSFVERCEAMVRAATAARAVALATAARTAALADTVAAAAEGLELSREDRDLAERAVTAELATVLQLPEVTTGGLLDDAVALTGPRTAVLEALASGRVAYRHVQVLLRETGHLPADVQAEADAALLPGCGSWTPTQLARRARSWAQRHDPTTMSERYERARAGRRVWVEPDRDGMAWLHALLPAPHAQAIYEGLSFGARMLRADETASPQDALVPQLRADLLVDLLLPELTGTSTPDPSRDTNGPRVSDDVRDAVDDGSGSPRCSDPRCRGRAWRPTVLVTVPLGTALGGDEPGELAGYGPVDARTARELLASASSFTRLLTDPVTDAVTDVDRATYAVTGARRRFLQVRDGTCRFPGCSRSTTACDVDHAVEWAAGGCSDRGNNAHLCRHHHRLKHRTRWRMTQAEDGTLTWTSPTGRTRTTHPAFPPAPPPPPPRAPEARAVDLEPDDPPF
ncbi:HNH endonuclease signature motif containing protein [Cellulomonas marina]|uniref:HNH nuclease domain-containing protein n=1 Tax=Cellulomonas marina TaxID=988821 RepID=A0A1I0YG27_9CELL|nr:HNH endonuclease signature motif containing protein [Cellulomonas marina]GIG28709.1 hypothetical protein Cma02nite_13090 [Cellulomonas marina]SFB12112.1 protein of unknown function [Cellulomonas marina]